MDIKFFARPLTITKNVEISNNRFLITASNGQKYDSPCRVPENTPVVLSFDDQSNVIDFSIPGN